jgi:hypothetical protein
VYVYGMRTKLAIQETQPFIRNPCKTQGSPRVPMCGTLCRMANFQNSDVAFTTHVDALLAQLDVDVAEVDVDFAQVDVDIAPAGVASLFRGGPAQDPP